MRKMRHVNDWSHLRFLLMLVLPLFSAHAGILQVPYYSQEDTGW